MGNDNTYKCYKVSEYVLEEVSEVLEDYKLMCEEHNETDTELYKCAESLTKTDLQHCYTYRPISYYKKLKEPPKTIDDYI